MKRANDGLPEMDGDTTNRTNLELKPGWEVKLMSIGQATNRTNLELKRFLPNLIMARTCATNRTNLELKLSF